MFPVDTDDAFGDGHIQPTSDYAFDVELVRHFACSRQDFAGKFNFADAKGAALMMMVEIMSAAMTGSNFSFEASSFYDSDGPPPRTGQFFLVFKPESLGGNGAVGRVEELAAAVLDQPGTRLPGDRRLANRKQAEVSGVEIPDGLFDDLTERAGG